MSVKDIAKTGTRKLLGLMLLLAFASGAWAQEEAAELPKLGIDLDSTFVSKYLWRGYDLFDDFFIAYTAARGKGVCDVFA